MESKKLKKIAMVAKERDKKIKKNLEVLIPSNAPPFAGKKKHKKFQLLPSHLIHITKNIKIKTSDLILISLIFLSIFSGIGIYIFSPKIPFPNVATGTPVIQSQIIPGQDIKWSMLVEKSQIEGGRYLVQLPKDATVNKVEMISEQQAKDFFITKPLPKLSLSERQKISAIPVKQQKHSQSFFDAIYSFFEYIFSGVGTIINNVSKSITSSNLAVKPIIQTRQAVYVNILAQVASLKGSIAPIIETAPTQEGAPIVPTVEEPATSTLTTETPNILEPEVVTPITPSATGEQITTQTTTTEIPTLAPVSPIDYVAVEYTTPAPEIVSVITDQGQQVTVSAVMEDPQAPLVDVLASTKIPEIFNVGQENQIQIKWQNEGNQEVAFKVYDSNNNGKLDYIEWTVPHLSTQTFNIIFISRAFQLDTDQTILADIYQTVKDQDDNYATIRDGQYVRVTFEQPLTNINDITIYARPTILGQASSIEVYPVYADADGNMNEGPKLNLVSDNINHNFSNINQNGKYRILLKNLLTQTETFDLKIVGANTDIDHIVDPAPNDVYWVGGTGNWSQASIHWASVSGGAPSVGNLPGINSNVHFDSNSGTGTIYMDLSNVSVINFDASSTTILPHFNIAGITITGDMLINNYTTSNGGAITFSGATNQTITCASAGHIDGSPIILNSDVTFLVNSGICTASSPISGAHSVTKIGAGQLTLGGNNSFSNGFIVKEGTVLAASTNALGGSGAGAVTLGDSVANSSSVTVSVPANTIIPNPIVLADIANATGTITLMGAANANNAQFTGGVTGNNNLTLGGSSGGEINFYTNPINISGKITNAGIGNQNYIRGGVGPNVTEIINNSTSKGLSILTNPISIGAGGITITDAVGPYAIAISSGITGTGNVILKNNGTTAQGISFTTAGINNAGTLTNSGSGSGTVTITGGVGPNVTAINQSSSTSLLGIYITAVTVNGGGTALTNSAGAAFNITSGVVGTGNLTLYNNSSTSQGVAITAGPAVNNVGTVTNLGSGSGSTVITAGVGANVTAVNQNSATSVFTIGGTIAVNSSGTTLTNSSGGALFTISGGANGTGNLIINNNSSTASGITISGGSVNNAGTITNSGSGPGDVLISATVVTAVTGVIQNSATSQLTLSGNNTFTGSGLIVKAGTVSGGHANGFGGTGTGIITLGDSVANNSAVTLKGIGQTFYNPIVLADIANATGNITIATIGNGCSFNGGITGNNNFTIDGSSSYTMNFYTGSINNAGTVTNSSASTGIVTIGSVIGTNVTGVIQNSTTSQLTLSGANTFTGSGLTIKAGIVSATTSTSALGGSGSGVVTLGDSVANNSEVTLKCDARTFANPIVLANITNATGTIVAMPSASGCILSGGVTGTNNLVLSGSSFFTLAFTTNPINNAGTVTNVNPGSGAITISGGVGANVTGINESSSTSALTISTTALTVNSSGTTLTNSAGTVSLTVSSAIGGTGNLNLYNNNSTTNGISLSAVNNIGTVNNLGSGSGTTVISGVIGTNVTGVIQNNINSQLSLYGANTFTGSGLTIKAGTVLGGSLSLSVLGGAGTGVVTLGDSVANNSAVTLMCDNLTLANPIVLANISNATGTITIKPSTNCSFSGGVTGTNNLVLNGSGTKTLTLSTNPINNAGTITNANAGTGAITISSVIGANVTGITQNSATSALTLSGINTTTSSITNSFGTLNLTQNSTYGIMTLAGDTITTFTPGKTFTLTNLVSNGTAGHLAVINSSVATSAATLTTASPRISTDYLSIKDSNPVQVNTWYAGTHSTSVSNTGNWLFIAPDITPPVLSTGVNPTTLIYDITASTVDIADVGTCTDTGNGMNVAQPYQVSYTDVGTSPDIDCSNKSYTISTAWGTSRAISFTGTTGHYYCIKLECKDASSSPNSTAYYSADNILYDVTDPTVSSVAVQNSSTINVVFSKAMGIGVTTASNYTVSGAGKGTLASNPNTVALVSGNTYVLTWTSGEMKNGGDITITVANVQDVPGNSIGSQNSGTDTDGGIGIAPLVGTTTLSGFTTFGSYIKGTGTIIGGTATDSDSGIDNATCEYTADNGISWAVATWTTNHCEESNISVANGTNYTFNTRVKDVVTNQGTGTVTSVYIGDTEAPTTSDNVSTNWYSTNQTITLSPVDIGSGVDATNYCIDTSGVCIPTTPGTSVNVTCVADATCQEYVRYYSNDKLGNTEATKNSTNLVSIDKQAPTTIADATPYVFNALTKGSVTVSLTCADAGGSGCLATLYCVDDLNTCVPLDPYIMPVPILTTGTSYIRYLSTDAVSNSETIKSQTIKITTGEVGTTCSADVICNSGLLCTDKTCVVMPVSSGGGTPNPPPVSPSAPQTITSPVIEYISQVINQIRQSILNLFGVPIQPTTTPGNLQPTTQPPTTTIITTTTTTTFKTQETRKEGISIYKKIIDVINSILSWFIIK
jgi:hypothetical protein